MLELPISHERVAATFCAFEPGATEDQVRQYREEMKGMYNYFVNVEKRSQYDAEQTVRGMYLEELDAAVAEREAKKQRKVRKATAEEVAALTWEDIMDGAGCDSYEEFEEKYGEWL